MGLHQFGIAGWQWLFVLEGLLAVVLALVVFSRLKDHPQEATWLPSEEKLWLVATLEQERKQQARITGSDAWAAFLSWRIWLLTVVFFRPYHLGLRHCSVDAQFHSQPFGCQ